jgi:hypothetical protein
MFKITAQVAILLQIQNNNKLGLKLPRVSAILLKIQNGCSAKIQNNKKLGLKLPRKSPC